MSNQSVTITTDNNHSFEVCVGTSVRVWNGDHFALGIVSAVDPGDSRGEVELETGGWFMPDGKMNIDGGWKIVALATLEEQNQLPAY